MSRPNSPFDDEAGPSGYRNVESQEEDDSYFDSPTSFLSSPVPHPEQPAIESIEDIGDKKGFTFDEWVTMIGPRSEIKNRMKNYLRLNCQASIREMVHLSQVIILYVCMLNC